jgi:hypothetical protein
MRRSRLLIVLAAVGLVAACSENTVTPPLPQRTNARFVHAISDVADVSALVNGIPEFRNVAYGGVSPTSSAWSPIEQEPEITVAPTTGGTAFYRDRFRSVTGTANNWTFIALGDFTAATRTDTVVVIRDTTGAPSGTAWIRVFNALDYLPAAGADTVDLFTYPAASPRPTVPDIGGLPRYAVTRYLERAPGTWRIDVMNNRAGASATPLFSTTVTIAAGSVRTLILRDPPSSAAAGTQGGITVLNDRN